MPKSHFSMRCGAYCADVDRDHRGARQRDRLCSVQAPTDDAGGVALSLTSQLASPQGPWHRGGCRQDGDSSVKRRKMPRITFDLAEVTTAPGPSAYDAAKDRGVSSTEKAAVESDTVFRLMITQYQATPQGHDVCKVAPEGAGASRGGFLF